MRAHARCFRIGDRLRHLRKRSHCHWCNEAESDSLALGSRLRSSQSGRPRARQAYPPDRSVSRCRLPFSAGPELHVERAIHMADTSQSARRIRVYPGVTGGTEIHGERRTLFDGLQPLTAPRFAWCRPKGRRRSQRAPPTIVACCIRQAANSVSSVPPCLGAAGAFGFQTSGCLRSFPSAPLPDLRILRRHGLP